eukprot:1151373-Rhodomonas_salina.3
MSLSPLRWRLRLQALSIRSIRDGIARHGTNQSSRVAGPFQLWEHRVCCQTTELVVSATRIPAAVSMLVTEQGACERKRGQCGL